MSAPPTVSIIIVNWNTADLLAGCLRSVAGSTSAPSETIVVDNASTDGSGERVRREFPWVRLLPQTENLGFARGSNVGLAAASAPWLLLLNPDTVLRARAVDALVSFLARTPAAGIAGPPLWNPDGSPQPSVQPFPTLGSELLRQTMLHRVLPGRFGQEARRRETRRVDVVTGAALCIRRECYAAIGPLDEGIFMFYEDTDWCRRASDLGWEIWYVDGPGVVHAKGGASVGAAFTRSLLDSLRGTVHYFRKHGGASKVGWLRAIALLGASLRSVRALLLLAVGRRRVEQRARLTAYARMIRWAVAGGEL
ncbi:MAG: glycosyltransferase family 2 protein [bacterium]